jgi:hypothetical protein
MPHCGPHAVRLYTLVACVCCLSPAVNRVFHVMVRGMLGPSGVTASSNG